MQCWDNISILRYIANLPTQYPYRYVYVLLKCRYIVSTNYRMYIAIIECISCMCSSSFTYQWSVVWSENIQLCEPAVHILLHKFDTNPTHYPIYQYIGSMEFAVYAGKMFYLKEALKLNPVYYVLTKILGLRNLPRS